MASSPPLSGRAEIYALLTLIRDAAEDAMREYEISRVPIPSLFQPVSFSPAPSPASSPGPGPGSRGPNSTSTTSNIYHGAIPKGPGYLSTLPLKKAIRTLEAACGQLCATLAPPVHTIVNVRAPCVSGAGTTIDTVWMYSAPCRMKVRHLALSQSVASPMHWRDIPAVYTFQNSQVWWASRRRD